MSDVLMETRIKLITKYTLHLGLARCDDDCSFTICLYSLFSLSLSLSRRTAAWGISSRGIEARVDFWIGERLAVSSKYHSPTWGKCGTIGRVDQTRLHYSSFQRAELFSKHCSDFRSFLFSNAVHNHRIHNSTSDITQDAFSTTKRNLRSCE